MSMQNIFGMHEHAMLVHERRLSLISSNIANAETPNYKAKDIDFKTALKNHSDRLRAIDEGRSEFEPVAVGDLPIHRTTPNMPSPDGNTVEEHVEQAKFVETYIRYQASMQFVSGKINKLKSAMSNGS